MSSLQISIIINSSSPPLTVQNELKPEQVEQLKVRQLQVTRVSSPVLAVLISPCPPPTPQIHNPSNHWSLSLPLQLIMSKRYDGSQQALDLKGLRLDPGIVGSSSQIGGGREESFRREVGEWFGANAGLGKPSHTCLSFLKIWWPRTLMLS